jgi:hypothetical protein
MCLATEQALRRQATTTPAIIQPRAHSLLSRDRAGASRFIPITILGTNSSTDFSWGHNGSGPAQLALAILTDYFGAKPGERVIAETLYEPFKFTVIAVLPIAGNGL